MPRKGTDKGQSLPFRSARSIRTRPIQRAKRPGKTPPNRQTGRTMPSTGAAVHVGFELEVFRRRNRKELRFRFTHPALQLARHFLFVQQVPPRVVSFVGDIRITNASIIPIRPPFAATHPPATPSPLRRVVRQHCELPRTTRFIKPGKPGVRSVRLNFAPPGMTSDSPAYRIRFIASSSRY